MHKHFDFAFAHATVPLSSPVHGHVVPSKTTESDHSAHVRRDKNKPYFYKEDTNIPRAGPIRYLSLPITIFLGMWLVFSKA